MIAPTELGRFLDPANPDQQVLFADQVWRPAGSGSGTVTSVDLTAPVEFSVGGVPITTAGTITLAWQSQLANLFFASPNGGPGIPSFRSIAPADLAGTPGAGKYWDGTGVWTTLPAGTGTVTSVDFAAPPEFSVSGNPITTSGTITLAWVTESANKVLAGPTTGGPATPAFRSLVAADLPAGTGTVTSVALAAPIEFSVTGSPVTGSGTLTLAWQSETQHTVFAAPSGSNGTPGFRLLVAGDIPALSYVTSVAMTGVTGILSVSGSPITSSGTFGLSFDSQSANQVFAGPTSGGAAAPTFRTLVAADIPSIPNLTFLINQTGHALSVGNVVRFNGTNYVKAQADSASNAEVVGIVVVVVDANNFFLLTNGKATTLSGLVAGTTYFLDPTTAGALTATEPTTSGQVTKPLLIADSTTSGYFFNMRGLVLGLSTQAANTFYAGPTTGAAAAPTFRTVVAEDLGTSTPTAGRVLASAGAATEPVWTALTGANVGITAGKDRNRPAANSTTNIYLATDTYQVYVNDQTNWYNTASGWDKVTVDSVAGGFTDTTYMSGPTSITAGPSMASGQTLVFGFYVISLPGTGAQVMIGMGLGNITNGWLLRGSAANSNKLAFLMKGINSDANIELNLTLTTGFHIVAVANFGSGSTLRASLDGGTVVASASLSGTYVPPTASSSLVIGRYFGATGLAASWMRFGFFQAYGTSLGDSDLQAVSNNTAAFVPGAITGDPTYDFQARWLRTEGAASGVNLWQIYGTSKDKTSYLTAQGSGIAKTFQ